MDVTGAIAVADSKVTANTTVFVYELLINFFFPFSVPLIYCTYGHQACLNRAFLPPPWGNATAVTQYITYGFLWLAIVLKAFSHIAPALIGVSVDDPSSSVLLSISSPIIAMVLLNTSLSNSVCKCSCSFK